ncbi:pilus assembly protein Flp/PilA [Microbacteriaceae bacterium SG_E_30_P1]|uniref:Pilus assembly protein Flp/PilA n=1 Tax=Antiquaquibacter oligotrophicus TaxID=2880260 RepID=A0ABT6KQN6_9MICO|nr:Flp family type IVb pilin [Antiquaquibacter oligotrophicus]MDH6182294.1 pilus assembly protein Flp/PilA [Antiquaquibacter oligotrophicus]UDF12050.1 Flp family type IVb pilin [Antiquaquibacter oligotrophicus]
MFIRTFDRIRSRLVRDETGATAVEYGLIVGLIAVVLVVAVAGLSGALGNMFGGIEDVLNNNVPAEEPPATP